jgi:hypothetical protein
MEEWLTNRKDFEGKSRGLIGVLPPEFAWRDWGKPRKSHLTSSAYNSWSSVCLRVRVLGKGNFSHAFIYLCFSFTLSIWPSPSKHGIFKQPVTNPLVDCYLKDMRSPGNATSFLRLCNIDTWIILAGTRLASRCACSFPARNSRVWFHLKLFTLVVLSFVFPGTSYTNCV